MLTKILKKIHQLFPCKHYRLGRQKGSVTARLGKLPEKSFSIVEIDEGIESELVKFRFKEREHSLSSSLPIRNEEQQIALTDIGSTTVATNLEDRLNSVGGCGIPGWNPFSCHSQLG